MDIRVLLASGAKCVLVWHLGIACLEGHLYPELYAQTGHTSSYRLPGHVSLEQRPAVAQSHVLTSGSPEPLQQGVAKGASEGVSYSPGNGPASARTLREVLYAECRELKRLLLIQKMRLGDAHLRSTCSSKWRPQSPDINGYVER
ncbi:hypothetical protein C0Q70_07151 [Pomacea canaliculata]|uniref:Uncharacterized protein n=1 Tax=Pomacea canaliculata TaxID=400727 RepID=A0A2T7PE84_POMCA|nr:hypothetical protein C0Q70_07151 [Pomacea canaliculata]